MSWDFLDSIGSFIGNNASTILPAAATIGGTIYAANQNSNAAKTSANAQIAGAKVQSDAIDRQIAAIRQGVAEGHGKYQEIQAQTKPSIGYLQSVMTGSAELTPEQQAAKADLLRQATNSSQVAGSALRGSGRSFVDAMRSIEGDFTNKALAQNRARADSAASQLASPYFNAAGSDAAASATQGQQVGSAISTQGGVNATGITGAADTRANAGLANAGLTSGAAGTVAGQIAAANKDANLARPSTQSYAPTPAYIPPPAKNPQLTLDRMG